MRRQHFNHEHCWELIPWVVNGRASETEQRTVLAHAEDCAECREELQRQRQMQQHMRGTDEVIPAPNASWQKLLAQIDEQPTPATKPHKIQRPWLIAAIWLQLVAIAALAGALFSSSLRPQPEYTTLSTPQTADLRAAVRVVFAPDAALDAVNRLLRSVECDIVAGPSEAGVYTLATANGKDVNQIIATLRSQPDVLFAEPTSQ
ncbi:hypothetical protein [Steroidobacter sp.]|uniref:hypothetical protein n=1 Tax=Steroidobacter sp. TaxID=1978227 RepID=UPI001A36BE2D|nr:hypothetical protein [Steroidobacter sp.]MBL8267951.1 hypothetical protein [Steroidobacter sp.]